jgi:Zn-dependent protease with chaperone function
VEIRTRPQGHSIGFKPALGMNTTSVRALVDKLAKLTGQDIKVVVEDSAKLDAYLHPMGHIVITTGLMNFYEDDEEMAFIIGHKFAHFLRGHYTESEYQRVKVKVFLTL